VLLLNLYSVQFSKIFFQISLLLIWNFIAHKRLLYVITISRSCQHFFII